MSNAEYNYKPSELGGPTWCIYNENRKSRDVEGEVCTTGFLESTTALILAEILENRSQTARFQNWGFFFVKQFPYHHLNLSLFASLFIGLLLIRICLA